MKLMIFTMNYRDCVKKIDNWEKKKEKKEKQTLVQDLQQASANEEDCLKDREVLIVLVAREAKKEKRKRLWKCVL